MSRGRQASTAAPRWRRFLPALPPRGWQTIPELRGRCAQLRDHLTARRWAADAELDACWPGGRANQARGLDAWVVCYAQLSRFMGRAEERQAATTLQRVVTEGLSDTPRQVVLSDGSTRTVYPQSYHVHELLAALDADIAVLSVADLAVALAASGDMVPFALRSDAVRTWCWIVTSAALPYDDTAPIPDAPAWTRTLTIADLVALVETFRVVDAHAISALCAAFPRTDGAPSRLGFAGFLGTFAASKGLDPLDVMRRWTLRRVCATALSEAITGEEARTRTEAASRARAGAGARA